MVPSWKKKMMIAPSKCHHSISDFRALFQCSNVFIVPLLGFVKKILIRFLSGVHKSYRSSLKERDRLLPR